MLLNGLNVGVININYKQYEATYPRLTLQALSFNNMPAYYDNSIYLLQLQESQVKPVNTKPKKGLIVPIAFVLLFA